MVELSLRLSRKRPFTSSKLPVDLGFERRLTIVRLGYSNHKLLVCLNKLKELILPSLCHTFTTIADKRANNTAEQHHAIVQPKLTRPLHVARTQTSQDRQKLDQKYFFLSLGRKRNTITLIDLNILSHLNTYRPRVLFRVLSPFWPVKGSNQNRLRTTSGAE